MIYAIPNIRGSRVRASFTIIMVTTDVKRPDTVHENGEPLSR